MTAKDASKPRGHAAKVRLTIALITVLALASVAGVLAYLTTTQTVVNNFTLVNNIAGVHLEEPSWDEDNGKEIEGGANVAKDPKVVNDSDTDVWAFIQVQNPVAEGVDYEVDGITYTAGAEDTLFYLGGLNADGAWVEVDTMESELDPSYVITTYAYTKPLAAHSETSYLYTDVTLLDYINADQIPNATVVTTTDKTTYTGADLQAMSDAELAAIANQVDVSATVDELKALSPEATLVAYEVVHTVLGVDVINTMYSIQAEGLDNYMLAWRAYTGSEAALEAAA